MIDIFDPEILAGILIASFGIPMVGILFAMILGLIPDLRKTEMSGRAKLCEAIAVNTSVLVSRNDIRSWKLIAGSLNLSFHYFPHSLSN